MILDELPEVETIPPAMEQQLPDPTEEEEEIWETTAPTETEETTWGGVEIEDESQIFLANSVIQIGDSLFMAQGFSKKNSDAYAATVNALAEKVAERGVTVVSAPCPTSIGVMIEEAFQERLKSVSQVEMLDYIHSGMEKTVVTVDTIRALLPHNGEYVYFRTDHHWTPLGAYYSYKALCEALNMECVDLENLETWDQGEFIGSLFGKAHSQHRLKKDNVLAYIPEGEIVNWVYYNSNSKPKEVPLLNDMTEKEKGSKYLTFGADCPLTHAENRSIPDAPNCLLIKDSFGNCYVPFLTQNFHNVYAMDYRTYRDLHMTDFIDKYEIDYVIFLPYITAIQSGQGVQLIDKLCTR